MRDDLDLLGGSDDHPHDDDPHEDHPHDDHPHDATDDPGRAGAGAPPAGDDRRPRAEAHRAVERRSRARRRIGTAVALVVLVALAGVVFLGGRALLGGLDVGGDSDEPADFAGAGVADVVVEVSPGDSTAGIGATLTGAGVVASAALFTDAATGVTGVSAVQPGFYIMRTQIPAADAVARLVAPTSRVGQLVIPEGLQLDDVVPASGAVNRGILTRISEASCVTLDGVLQCTDVEQLSETAATGDLAALGVPAWAVEPVSAVTGTHKRLEGLIRPGSYDILPAAPAVDVLAQLITTSATSFEILGLPQSTAGGLGPYEVLVASSLVEREALPADFSRVARVIYNRLAIGQALEFDSTVNYPLEVQNIATTSAARDEVTLWNTYASPGLPATPISSPGDDALTAAEQPAEGTWLYFVTVDSAGTTVFSDTFAQHQAAIETARANGVFG